MIRPLLGCPHKPWGSCGGRTSRAARPHTDIPVVSALVSLSARQVYIRRIFSSVLYTCDCKFLAEIPEISELK